MFPSLFFFSRLTSYISRLTFLLLFLSACSADSFPDPPGADGFRDAPFSTTYLFQFKTGSRDIVPPNNEDGFLRIISQADIMTLKNAASTSQLTKNGLIGGIVQGPQGPAGEVALQITDAEGTPVGQGSGSGPERNLFYNSLGRVPDLTIDQGTGSEGTFTLFNAPPGELFFQAIRGGRGNGRITSFAGAVSLGRIDILPVFPEKIGILGVVTDANGGIPQGTASFFGRGETGVGNAAGLFILPFDQGLPTQGEFLIRLSAPSPGYRETIHRFDTAMEKVLQRQQAFDPLTADNLSLFSERQLQEMAAQAKILLGPLENVGVITGRVRTGDGTGQKNAAVTPLDAAGTAVGEIVGKVFYLNEQGEIDPALTETTDNSRFALFLNGCPPELGEIFLHVNAESVDPQNQQRVFSTGRAVAYCQPGTVFVQDLVIQSLPADTPTSPTDGKPLLTVPVNGRVTSEGGNPIPEAQIEIVGSNGAVTAVGEAYQIPAGTYGDISPLLANSDYTLRTSIPSDPNSIPTYQTISTGPAGGKRDLILLSASVEAACQPGAGGLRIFGTVRDLGLIDPLRGGRAAEGISLKVFRENGEEVGRVVYPQSGNGATSGNGRFLVCDLPAPGLYQLRVVSPEDSGAALVQVYTDGATVVSLAVNKALPKEVLLTGQAQSLIGPEEGSIHPVGDASITVLGSQRRITTDALGAFSLSLESNSRYIFRIEREGYLPSYNYQIETPARIRSAASPPLWTLSNGELATLAGQVGLAASPEEGVLAGKVVVRGFAPEGIGINLNPSVPVPDPVSLLSGFFNEDSHFDLLTVLGSGEIQIFLGDGLGGFSPKSPPCQGLQGLQTPLQGVEAGDFNRDGFPDLAVIDWAGLSTFFGNPQGCFEKGETLPLSSPQAIGLADLNGDGFSDIVAAAGTFLHRLINQANGSFKEEGAPIETCGLSPRFLSIRQIGSTLIDIVVGDESGNLCDIPFNQDRNPIEIHPPLSLPSPAGITGMKTAFLNSDALPDLIVFHQGGGAVFLDLPPTEGTATLRPSFTLSDNFRPETAAFADLNRDGRIDLIAGGGQGVFSLLGNGDGTFGAATLISPSPTPRLTLSDFNRDGREDLVLSIGSNLALFRGADRSGVEVRVEARNESGEPVGQVAYLNGAGQIEPEATATRESGRFIIFNVPPGFTHLRATEGGSGNALVTVYAGGLTYTHLNINPIAPSEVLIEGQVINPTAGEFAGIDVRGIHIVPLGAGTEAVSGDLGAYQIRLGANSEHIIKLDP